MANQSTAWIAALAALLIWITPLSAAELNLDITQNNINTFKHSDLSAYAPKTVERADAYLGAAMLAQQLQKTADESAALEQANASIAEARRTAKDFRQRFATLLELRQEATSITQIIVSSGQTDREKSFAQIIATADKAVQRAIIAHEQGHLNKTQAYASSAESGYRKILDQSMPTLSNMAELAVSKAANVGASQYAPVLYSAAKQKATALRAYSDGIDHTPPAHPEDALYLAQEARHMAQRVKAWRRKTGSHEAIVLKQRTFKLQLATVLGMHINPSNVLLNNVSDEKILAAVRRMKQALVDERKAGQVEQTQLKQQYETELASRLAEQASQLTKAQQTEMSGIKSAFKAKLAQETYEQKRQQRVHALFKKGKAEILANLDGSLLIRISVLKFASGSSKISSKYFNMLGKLKDALAIYADRDIRIEGHTDNQGGVKANQRLSLKRAEAVRDFLIAAGVDGTRLKALGYGEVRPIATNKFARGRAMNRRIDVIIEAVAGKS